MVASKSNGSSLPPPHPRSPPQFPDLYGKRRELARVQMLQREIGFLDEELKSLESIPPASRSCKEVVDFVTGNVDPLIPTSLPFLSIKSELRRLEDHVVSGNGSVECAASTFHGFAAVVVRVILVCPSAATPEVQKQLLLLHAKALLLPNLLLHKVYMLS
ncbi:hypothetical protein SASPL_154601 [Salvia splendens]|uniref:G protein gamma domain-containing protein n=1 Tax=Salvia splendens TaxID=180675 RepID=A0A8X8YZE8_SALSN|nr:hypothetical protein SASPL_154601 [Salvia splendens]